MRNRLSLLVVLALVLAACGGATTSSTTLPEVEPPQAQVLSYGLEAGTSFSYEVDLDQSIDITTTGDAQAFGDEEIPEEMAIQMVGTSVFTQTVADGPEPGTYSVTITGDFSDIEFSGTIDGEPVDPAEIPDMAELDDVDVTVVVDEQGNVISGDASGMEDFLGAGGLGDLGGMAEGVNPGRFVGPPLSDGEVTVGDTWSESVEIPSLTGEGSAGTSEIVSTITGTDTVNGVEVFVIETSITVPEISFDLAEMLLGMFEAFLPEDASEEELAEFEALAENLRFNFSMAPSETNATTLFDSEAGLAVRSDYSGAQNLSIDVNMPDEETGEMMEFGMSMEISQTIGYRLVDSEGS